jgi:hypothetical protein
MGGFSCGRTKLGGCYYIEHLALSRSQGRRIESEAGNFEEINRRSPRSPFLANFRFANHFPIIPSFVTITTCYPIVLN